MVLDINSDAVVAFTNTLEKMHRSAFPVAVREALNMAAFDVKKVTMPKSSKVFTQRNPTFFKATSKVAPAQGFDIKTMKSVVGFMPQSGVKESGGATKDLEQQEHSGSIEHRSFIPLAGARTGNNYNRGVSAKMRMAVIKSKIVDAKKSKAKTKAGRFFSSATFANNFYGFGGGGFVLSEWKNSKGNRLLMSIAGISRSGGNTKLKYKPVYAVKSNRSVRVQATHFMSKASNTSANKIEQAYITAAKKQIARLTK